MGKFNDELLIRVRDAKQRNNLSYGKIAAAAGMATSTVTNQILGHYKLDIEVVCAVLELCPDISAEWIMRGKEDDKLADIIRRVEALERKAK